jgi:predicted nucleotidyltransferase
LSSVTLISMSVASTTPSKTFPARPPSGYDEAWRMANSDVLSEAEQTFLRTLNDRGVRYLLVGMSAALLQGARGATDDIDLWFETTDDPGIGEAAKAAGGFWYPGNWGMRPPALAGDALGDRFDVVMSASGLASFAEEYANGHDAEVDGIPIKVLPLPRIIVSKRAAGRAKDLAQIPALEEAIAVSEKK